MTIHRNNSSVSTYNTMFDKFSAILKKSASAEAVVWLDETLASQRANFEKRPFYYAFSGVSRRFEKRGVLEFSEEDDKALHQELPGFTVKRWDQFRLARVMLLLVLGEQDEATFLETIDTLLNTADLREHVAILSAFALLPHGEKLVEFAREGLRSNIVDVFDAVALDNPFPCEHFSDDAWNQMVLKALFISRPLYRIYGIDYRANLTLAEALSNLAHERWAADRWVSPELWRSCTNFLTDQIVEDISRVAETDEPGQKEAAALIVNRDEEGKLDHIRDRVKTYLDDVADHRLTWHILGEQL